MREASVDGDLQALEALNLRIGELESADAGEGKAAAEAAGELDRIIGPQLAFRKANGEIVGRDQFIHPETKNAARRDTEVTSISLHGDRAVVECMVTMAGTRYHNLRLFVREGTEWKLLGWANEPI